MADVLELPAPAKLNLFLRVTGRRPDGYHELQTAFQLLDWGDDVRLEKTAAGRIERGAEISGVPEDRDLSLRAARTLRAHCPADAGARITVRKRIPQGGGLGGASTDAATVLVGLNALWGCGLDADDLARLALTLGADVPLFVRGRSAWGEGVGERLLPLALGERHYVLLMPPLGMSTAEVFADPALRRDRPPLDPRLDYDFAELGNDCLPVVLARRSELAEWLAPLAEFGRPRMSGTGSTFFIEVSDGAAAEQAAARLKVLYNGRAVGIRAVRGVDRSPLLRRLQGAAPPGQ